MMRAWLLGGGLLLGLVVAVGCSKTSQQEKSYSIPMTPPIDQAKQLLQQYANGNPVGSEATGFQGLVADVRKTDSAKADILEKALQEIEKNPRSAASVAKGVLPKL